MAELQWIIEVRCTNALLAEMKVGERGEHVIVNIPNRNFDPAEFDKLIAGLEVAGRIVEENKKAGPKPEAAPGTAQFEVELGTVVEIEARNDLYQAQILKTGELVLVNTGAFFAPSEFRRFITELKAIRSRMAAQRR